MECAIDILSDDENRKNLPLQCEFCENFGIKTSVGFDEEDFIIVLGEPDYRDNFCVSIHNRDGNYPAGTVLARMIDNSATIE